MDLKYNNLKEHLYNYIKSDKFKIKAKYELKRHFYDSTAIVTMFNFGPAILETTWAKMTDEVSRNSRLLSIELTYAGVGSLSKVRDYTRKRFEITDHSSEFKQGLHDILFFLSVVLPIRTGIYIGAGETDLKKIAIGLGGTAILGTVLGWPAGYLMDVYRDIAGLEESERMPELLRRQSLKFKKTLIATLLATSLIATGLVYHFTPDKFGEPIIQQEQIEKVHEKNNCLEQKVLEE